MPGAVVGRREPRVQAVRQCQNSRMKSEAELVAVALGLGAADFGGPLVAAERRLIAGVVSVERPDLAGAIRLGADPLGDAFIALRSPLTRRSVGAFYTPPEIVGPMVAWALAQSPIRVVDAGCGSGRFAMAVARTDSSVEIVAVDMDPLATLLTRANLAVLNARHATVLNADYLTVRLPDHDGITAWVGNPPYVRHHDLDPCAKAWAVRTAKHMKHKVSGLAGLHALFFLATAAKAKPGDVGCFVTSAEWLDVSYGSVVRNLLLNGLGGASLDLFDPRSIPFADVMTTALITSFVVGSEREHLAVRLVSGEADIRLGDGTLVEIKRVASSSRWTELFRAPGTVGGETLGSVARVHRGVATGANAFFTMTKAEAQSRGLSKWARPAITGAEEIIQSSGIVRDGPGRRILIDLPAVRRDELPQAALEFVEAGEREGINRRYLAEHRSPWWRLGPKAPPIVASYMARRAPVFALNPDGLVPLNVAHGIWPRQGIDAAELVARLNAAATSFVGSGRTYHGGLEKFEPREMEALLLP